MVLQDVNVGENHRKGIKASLCYFSQLDVNLQLCRNKTSCLKKAGALGMG